MAPRPAQLTTEQAEDIARDAAARLGYLGIAGAACAVRDGDAAARCMVRAREESATVQGEQDVVMLHLGCNPTGCWPIATPATTD